MKKAKLSILKDGQIFRILQQYEAKALIQTRGKYSSSVN